MKKEETGKKTFLGSGQYGKCYVLENGMVLKLYNESRNLKDIEKFKYFLKYKNESFLFPIDFIYDNESFHGYITKMSMGKSIEQKFPTIKLDNLAKHSKLLEQDMKYISEGKILIDDFNNSNVLYDDKKLEVIDSDFYRIRDDLDINEVKKRNIQELRGMISVLFIEQLITKEESEKIIEKIIECENKDNGIDDMIFEIKDYLEKYYKEKINSIEDLNEILKR